jgi:hypothetical protein
MSTTVCIATVSSVRKLASAQTLLRTAFCGTAAIRGHGFVPLPRPLPANSRGQRGVCVQPGLEKRRPPPTILPQSKPCVCSIGSPESGPQTLQPCNLTTRRMCMTGRSQKHPPNTGPVHTDLVKSDGTALPQLPADPPAAAPSGRLATSCQHVVDLHRPTNEVQSAVY